MRVVTVVPGLLAKPVQAFAQGIALLQQPLFLFIAVFGGSQRQLPVFPGILKTLFLALEVFGHVLDIVPDSLQTGINLLGTCS